MAKKMKKIYVVLSLVFIISVSLVSFGIAYAGNVRGMGLLGVSFFLTCGVLIVLAQLIPAGIILSSLIGSAFSSNRRNEVPVQVS